MEEYRPTILGRALADVLQELEASTTVDGDQIFGIFDEIMRDELKTAMRAKAQAHEHEDAPQAVFTHQSLEIQGQVHSFNRYMDKWTIHASLGPHDLKMDHAVVDLHPPQVNPNADEEQEKLEQVDILVKLHHSTPTSTNTS